MEESEKKPETAVVTYKLPTLQELYSGAEELAVSQNSMNVLLNQPPKKEWIKEHPTAKKQVNGAWVPVEYIPIERVEYLLTRLFIHWWFEIKAVQLIANSVEVHGTLHYKNQITGEWEQQDGVGAAPLQTDAGLKASDFSAIKSNAVQLAAPAAKSYAIKDAADCIGKLFGKDLNRADQIAYDNLVLTFAQTDPKRMEAESLLRNSTLSEDMKNTIGNEIKSCLQERLDHIIEYLKKNQITENPS